MYVCPGIVMLSDIIVVVQRLECQSRVYGRNLSATSGQLLPTVCCISETVCPCMYTVSQKRHPDIINCYFKKD